MDEKGVECVWYKAFTKDRLVEYKNHPRYEYTDYVPGYTMEQKTMILKEIDSLMEKLKDDVELKNILERYLKDIEKNVRIDV